MKSEFNELITKKIQKLIQSSESKDKVCFFRYYSNFDMNEIFRKKTIQNNCQNYKLMIHSFNGNEMQSVYCPFLSWIRELYNTFFCNTPIDEFMEKCNVYFLQRGMISHYIQYGYIKRDENVIPREIRYEKHRFIQSLKNIFIEISKEYNIVMILCNLHFAQQSTIELLLELIKDEKKHEITIIGSYDESYSISKYMKQTWNEFISKTENSSMAIECDCDLVPKNSDENNEIQEGFEPSPDKIDEYLYKLNDMMKCMALDQAKYYLDTIYQYYTIEKIELEQTKKIYLLLLYSMVCIYCKEIKAAYVICKKIHDTDYIYQNIDAQFYFTYVNVLIKLYSGQIDEALTLVDKARSLAKTMDDKKKLLDIDMLNIIVLINGCEDVFVWEHNIEIPKTILLNAKQNSQWNHLAYAYLFGFIDREIINLKEEGKRNHYSLDKSDYFVKGMEIAKKIDNVDIQIRAWQKNGVVASTLGLFEDIIYSYNKSLEIMEDFDRRDEETQIYNGIGYSCIINERYDMANQYFRKSIELAMQLEQPRLLMETIYNLAVNGISSENYKVVIKYVLTTLQFMNILGIQRIKVCNVSKLYGLLILGYLKTGKLYDAKLYFEKMQIYLNHILCDENPNYEMWEDDIFLYYMVRGMINVEDKLYNEARDSYRQARYIWNQSNSKQTYIYATFVQEEARLYELMEDYEKREILLLNAILFCEKHKYEKSTKRLRDIINNKKPEITRCKLCISEKKLQEIIKFARNYGIKRELQNKNKILDFFENWVELLNRGALKTSEMITNSLNIFLNTFNLDGLIYIDNTSNGATVKYKNKDVKFNNVQAKLVIDYFKKHRKRAIICRFDKSYRQHEELVSIFTGCNIASMLAIPFIVNEKVTSVFVTFRGKHMNYTEKLSAFTEEDCDIYRTSFSELMEAATRENIKFQLEKSSVTDILTHLNNRQGMKKYIEQQFDGMQEEQNTKKKQFVILYMDLDNFKYCNDHFGHEVGDAVLVAFSRLIERIVSNNGCIVRYGGDEFVVILPDSNEEEGVYFAERIYSTIKQSHGLKSTIENTYKKKVDIEKAHQITCSIGIASGKTSSVEGIARILKKADDALYQIKKTTKNNYMLWKRK